MKVSIITVTYNSAETLAMAIESVLRQSYPDIEYIVKDGGSTDRTIEILKEYEPKFHGRMKWVSEKDKGIYDAMNKGIEMAAGDIVGILNSDDFFTGNNIVKKIVDTIEKENVDAVYGDVHFVKPENLHKCTRYYSGSIFRPWMIRVGFLPPHPSLYVKRNVYERFGNYNASYKISADFEFIARLTLIHKIKMKYIHMDMVTMRLGGASTNNWRSRLLGAKENIIACRTLGITTNKILVLCKFPIKIFESVLIRK